MSVHDELQSLLNDTQPGIFLTKEKKQELARLDEAFFAPLADTGRLIRGAIQTISKVESKIGKEIQNVLNKLNMEKFKKDLGVKDIDEEELDEAPGSEGEEAEAVEIEEESEENE